MLRAYANGDGKEIVVPTYEELLALYPPSPSVTADDVRTAIKARQHPDPVFIVLDDDPTGTQSVTDLPVLMAWDVEDFQWALAEQAPAIYVMTNSRSLDPHEARRITIEAVTNALSAAQDLDVTLAFATRSDSTLRGHFPLEPDTIAEVLASSGQDVDGVVLVPAFPEAGRITVGGTHYARIGEDYLPVSQTEFAQDATFGYRTSRLSEWVEEKTKATVTANTVSTPSLTDVRTDPERLARDLSALSDRQVIAPDIASEEDLRALSLALIRTEDQGQHFIYRVGPPFMRTRIGQEPRTPLTSQDVMRIRDTSGTPQRPAVPGGLVVVGSHVALTTSQLDDLRSHVELARFEIDVATVIDPGTREKHIQAVVSEVVAALRQGSVIINTSRRLVVGVGADESLDISRRVSDAVVETVHRIVEQVVPRFVVAKGGITSSDVAARGLDIRHARCIGPMLPGIVSLWAAQDGLAQGVPYIVFPGNVGTSTSLTEVVRTLER